MFYLTNQPHPPYIKFTMVSFSWDWDGPSSSSASVGVTTSSAAGICGKGSAAAVALASERMFFQRIGYVESVKTCDRGQTIQKVQDVKVKKVLFCQKTTSMGASSCEDNLLAISPQTSTPRTNKLRSLTTCSMPTATPIQNKTVRNSHCTKLCVSIVYGL